MDDQYQLVKEHSELRLLLYKTLTSGNIDKLKNEIERNLLEGCSSLEVDVSSLNVIDSITLGFFAWLHQVYDLHVGIVSFRGVNSRLKKVFETVGFLTHSKVFSFVQMRPETKAPQTVLVSTELAFHKGKALLEVVHRTFYPSTLELTQMRTFLDEFLDASSLLEEQKDDIRIFAGEAFANAITHGAREVVGPCVRVELRLYEHEFVMDVYDNGANFDGEFEPPSDMFRIHGRGILLMRELADSVEFMVNDDPLEQGTTVRLVKRLD